jgi:tetratricopeptide (TPR) repeat protein
MAGLEAAGFDPFLDRHDIAAGEDWEIRLGRLLVEADTVVFVISPASIASDRCGWEVDKAAKLAKRIIPVVAIDVAEADTPEKLRRLNYVFFTRGTSFGAALRQLSQALRTDLDWVRDHTRLGELASRWQAQGKSEALLLRGSELQVAQRWLAGWKPGAPDVTASHRDFVSESEASENARNSLERRRLNEIEDAQQSREEALEKLEKALKRIRRINFIWASAALAVVTATAAIAGGLTWTYGVNTKRTSDENIVDADRAEEREDQRTERTKRQADEYIAGLQEEIRSLQLKIDSSDSDMARRRFEEVDRELQRLREEVNSTLDRPQEIPVDRIKRINKGIDVDVFWCVGVEGAQDRAQIVYDQLTAESEAQLQRAPDSPPLGFDLGRIRLRPLSQSTNALPAYSVQSDVIRAENVNREKEQAGALSRFVAAATQQSIQLQVSDLPVDRSTPFYLSVFLCAPPPS